MSLENAARAICRLTNPCWSMVDEIMNPENPMFKKANAARFVATGQTEREFYIECAKIAWNEALETAAVLVETKTVSRGHPPSNRPHIIKRRYPSLTSMGMAKAIREIKVVT